MREYGVLTCPVCDQRYVSSVAEARDPEALKSIARDHLRTHRIDESKLGIYGVLMVRQMGRVAANATARPETRRAWMDGAAP
ncbi:hypothetical protein [Haladaptatus sp. DYSN1]|uniref:hypothetical protein n=1 Tax=unclassified Haladaptatus TaxID=2622732 RepID=UPI002404E8E7|nr:hypothetical protein [Haladaptatus sp. DYSN1]